MFICPNCKNSFQLPKCCFCQNNIDTINGIYQMDNTVSDDSINFDNTGTYVSEFAKLHHPVVQEINKLLGDGILLDIGCGDGYFTLPLAKLKKKIIAGDISTRMLQRLLENAKRHSIDLDTVTLVKMNILDLPICDNSINIIIANGLFHLLKNPEIALSEIKRVLKSDGLYLAISQSPSDSEFIFSGNEKSYHIMTDWFRKRYWELMKEKGIYPKPLNHYFNIYQECDSLFNRVNTLRVKYSTYGKRNMYRDFIYPLKNKMFLDQTGVPADINNIIFNTVIEEMKFSYEDFLSVGYFYRKKQEFIIDLYQKKSDRL